MQIQSVSKALAGTVVAAVVAYAARHNVVLDQSVSDALVVLLAAILGFATVWIAPKNK